MSNKMEQEMKILEMHLTKLSLSNEINTFSGFVAALGDARTATGRDGDGNKIQGGYHGCWLGTIGYLALLDQIGTCFKPRSASEVEGNTITKALTYFTTLEYYEIEAIYALRCAFAHDFSLSNISYTKQGLMHRFEVSQGPIGKVVVLPKEKWNGDYNNINDDNTTIINLELLGDMVEGIYKRLLSLVKNSELEIVLPGGVNELVKRYWFCSFEISCAG